MLNGVEAGKGPWRGSFTEEERLKPDVGLKEKKGGEEVTIMSTGNSGDFSLGPGMV